MKNAAGDWDADRYLPGELIEAGIEVVDNRTWVDHPEIHTHFTGRLLGWTFRRHWYYWAASCRDNPQDGLDLEFAQPMHELVGQEVRLAGHCGCPAPKDLFWMEKLDPRDRQLISRAEYKKVQTSSPLMRKLCKEGMAKLVVTDDPSEYAKAHGRIVAVSYHIDTQEGLNIFASTLKMAHRVKEEREKNRERKEHYRNLESQRAMEEMEGKYSEESVHAH